MSRCAECRSRSLTRTYYSVMRLAGGDYRRAARKIWTTVCSTCVSSAMAYHDKARRERRNPGTYWGQTRMSLSSLVKISERMGE